MAQTMVNFRMDEDLKKGMEQACKEMGLSMTTAFTKKHIAKTRKVFSKYTLIHALMPSLHFQGQRKNLRDS